MFFCSPISSVQKKACTSFPQMSFLHMVWIKILFPVQAFPLSGYRFPICLCLKYCPQKSSADVILCVRALKNQATGILEYAYGIALDTSELTTYLQPAALIPAYTATFSQITERLQQKYILTEFIRNFQSTVSETQRKCRFFFSQRRQIL